jgi:transcriptional regulator with XRE-family HTH domain
MVVDSFSERLNSALEKEGFPPKNKGRIQLLAEMVGLTHRGASKWLSGETCPPAKKYADLAKKLNVREEWLRTGELPIVNEAIVPLLPALSNPVAVYRAEDFLSQSKKPIQYVNCDLVSKGELFAIKLDSVLLDNKKLFQDGDFVLVNFENYPVPIFRQLLIAGSSLYLHAHNPKFDRLLLTHPQRILGVMIQAILSFA